MFELKSKLSTEAFKAAANKADKGVAAKGNSGNEFAATLERVQGKDISEVVKVLSNEIDLKPQKDITAIQTKSMDEVPFSDKPTAQTTTAMDRIASIMGEVNDGQAKLQRLVDLVVSGQKLSPQEMIAVEAGVFSLTQELELVGKVTQEATQGVRQTLNTNLG